LHTPLVPLTEKRANDMPMNLLKNCVIDPRASRFIVRAFAGGIGAGLGYGPTLAIRDFEGGTSYHPVTLEDASLWVKVKAASIVVAEEMSEDERRQLEALLNEEVLRTSKFPEVSFKSLKIRPVEVTTGLYRIDVSGNLTLNGITRTHSFVMQVSLNSHDVRAYGDFTIRQSDYEIRRVTIAGGLLELQDELKFSFYILARPRDASLSSETPEEQVVTGN